MSDERAPSDRSKSVCVRRAVVGLLVVLGLLAGGAIVTYVTAIYGGPIERFIAPMYQRVSGRAILDGRGAGVTTKLITTMAVFGRTSINAVPLEISEHDTEAVFGPDWTDSYVDPLLKLRKTTHSTDGTLTGWEWAPGDSVHTRVVYAFRSGWPLDAMRGVLSGVDTNTFPAVKGAYWERRGIAPGSEEMPQIVMPLGFATNTVFFATAIAAVTFGPLLVFRFVRREMRRARVQCLLCGYKLKSRVALCSECGNKAPRTW